MYAALFPWFAQVFQCRWKKFERCLFFRYQMRGNWLLDFSSSHESSFVAVLLLPAIQEKSTLCSNGRYLRQIHLKTTVQSSFRPTHCQISVSRKVQAAGLQQKLLWAGRNLP